MTPILLYNLMDLALAQAPNGDYLITCPAKQVIIHKPRTPVTNEREARHYYFGQRLHIAEVSSKDQPELLKKVRKLCMEILCSKS